MKCGANDRIDPSSLQARPWPQMFYKNTPRPLPFNHPETLARRSSRSRPTWGSRTYKSLPLFPAILIPSSQPHTSFRVLSNTHLLHIIMIPQMSRQAMRPAFAAIQRRTLMGGHPTGPTYNEQSLRAVPFSFKNPKAFALTLVSFLGLGFVGLPSIAWAWTWYKPGGLKNSSG
ncbi:hypothetical protein BD626DRAFT_505610 [Schizophyllum amplum]|uniref:Cytochrome c oxidase subunit VIIc-domain-containing protein n=1 Tax=Schizophyllum amplum TaxID=97359 RepID=A0A550C5P7_9AGAR|nr:hypothetical protein BD626DRAFT_505610 [Auriculariopsis ampla]